MKYGDYIRFYPPVPIEEVRKLMWSHDVYVFSSNGYEGWGAVVSEALEEGMRVIASSDSGAGATLLPKDRQFRSSDVNRLVELLRKEACGQMPVTSIGEWNAKTAAKALLDFVNFGGGR